MKRLTILVFAIAMLSGCKAVNQSSDQPKFEETHWKLIAMNKKPADLGDNGFIQFKDDKATGKAGCNSFSAEYVLVNNKLSFDKIVSTKMYCEGLMSQESQIIANLEKVKKFDIRYGLLYLYGADDLLLTFKK